MNPREDHEIEMMINTLLRADSRVDERETSVRVDDGTVTISGIVDSAAELRAALEVAESAPGVRFVVPRLAINNHVEFSDDELRSSVRAALLRDLDVNSPDIGVEARGGTITLTGRADSFRQKAAAESVAWWKRGVTDVVSYITVDGVAEPDEEA